MNEYLEIAVKHFNVNPCDGGYSFSYQFSDEVVYIFKYSTEYAKWYVYIPAKTKFTPLYFKNAQEFSYWVDM